MKIIELLTYIFDEFPWLFFVCLGLFFALTVLGLIVQSNYESDHKLK